MSQTEKLKNKFKSKMECDISALLNPYFMKDHPMVLKKKINILVLIQRTIFKWSFQTQAFLTFFDLFTCIVQHENLMEGITKTRGIRFLLGSFQKNKTLR